MSNLLEQMLPNKQKQHILGKLLWMVTRQPTLHLIDIPVPKGIHNVEQIWHSITSHQLEHCQQKISTPIGANCHKGVVFQTIKSFVHALSVSLQMTEATTK